MIVNIAINTETGKIVSSLGDNVYRDIEIFTHPISKKKTYCFVSTKKILPSTYPLHGIMSKKEKWANIFDEATQIKIDDFFNQ